MSEQVLEIANSGMYIKASRGFLQVFEQGVELGRVPLDTIHCLLISAEGATLSKSVFSRLAEENIPIIICGNNYAPISIAHPLSSHYKALDVVKNQINCPKVLKKQLWKSVILSKIGNQKKVLEYFKPERKAVIDRLALILSRVKSGDSENHEAQAARIYWPALFGKSFRRQPELRGVNSFLNYGYAILRSAVIRALCSAGLLPLLGIHHHNYLNAFCLADDLMEPLRPLVDAKVKELIKASTLAGDISEVDINEVNTGELSPVLKREISSILKIKLKSEGFPVLFTPVLNNMAFTLAKCFAEQENKLILPELVLPFGRN